jgi:hypothetical protein
MVDEREVVGSEHEEQACAVVRNAGGRTTAENVELLDGAVGREDLMQELFSRGDRQFPDEQLVLGCTRDARSVSRLGASLGEFTEREGKLCAPSC